MGFILSVANFVRGGVVPKNTIKAIKIQERDKATIRISQNI